MHDRRTDCTYVAGEDETRSAAAKRTLRDSEHRNIEYEEMHRYLLSRSEPEAVDILRRLRDSQDLSATLGYVKEGDLLIQVFPRASNVYSVNIAPARSPLQVELATVYPHVYLMDPSSLFTKEKESWTASHTDRASRMIGGQPDHLDPTAELPRSRTEEDMTASQTPRVDFSYYPDARIAQAKCHPWTVVIDDEELFRTLLSLYFAWHQDHYHLFDKDSFLNDLVDQGSTYCAPMLVNALLSLSYVSALL